MPCAPATTGASRARRERPACWAFIGSSSCDDGVILSAAAPGRQGRLRRTLSGATPCRSTSGSSGGAGAPSARRRQRRERGREAIRAEGGQRRARDATVGQLQQRAGRVGAELVHQQLQDHRVVARARPLEHRGERHAWAAAGRCGARARRSPPPRAARGRRGPPRAGRSRRGGAAGSPAAVASSPRGSPSAAASGALPPRRGARRRPRPRTPPGPPAA